MSNSDFEKQKVALYEKQLKERGALISKHNDVISAHGNKENLPPETAKEHQNEINKMNEKHSSEMKSFFNKHQGFDQDKPNQEKEGVSKSKDKDKSKDVDKDD